MRKNYRYDQAFADKVNSFATRKAFSESLRISSAATWQVIRNLKDHGFAVTIPDGRRGFAAMSKEKQLVIASKGGKSVPAEKRSFSVNRKLASASGSKGGGSRKQP